MLDDICSECKIVDDDYFIGLNWMGDVNFDGIEVIMGFFKFFVCSVFVVFLNFDFCEDVLDSFFIVLSLILKEVGEFIEKFFGVLVKFMKFLKFELVGGWVDIFDNGYLEELDLMDLSKVDYLFINGMVKFKNVKVNGIYNVICKGCDCGI